MKLPGFILFGAFLLGGVFSAIAETTPPYSALTWQAEDGLPDNRVVGLAQSADGFLWVATQGGLVRFDGVQFRRVAFTDSPGVIAGTLRLLMQDRLGRIWLAREENGTLFCFEGNQVRLLNVAKNETQMSMALDGRGDLWITYNTARVIRCNHDGTMDSFSATNGLPGGGVCWVASDWKGTLWFAQGNHVGIFQNGRFNVLENFHSPELRIAAARSGGIWVCDGQRVLRLNDGAETVELGKMIPDTGTQSGFTPSVIFEDRAGVVWVGTASAGLFRCDSNAAVRVDVSNPSILSLAEDLEGNLWVGTRGGLNRVHRRAASLIKSAIGLPFEGAQSICQDATGALWVAGENGVLARSRGTNWIIQPPFTGPIHATCVAADTNGSVWIGAWGGMLYHWANGRFENLNLESDLGQKSPRSLLVTKNGDLWIATDSPDVLYRRRGEKLETFALPSGRRLVRAMAEDTAGNLWAGASDGLLVRISNDTVVDETVKSGALSIRCLHAATNGDVWIGYAGAGVGRLRNGQIIRFGREQGLPNDYIAQILTDDRGNIWFGSNQGIFRVREQDFDDVASGATKQVEAAIYGRSEGMPGLQASFDYCPTSLLSSDGRLFFSMLSGLAEVRLDCIRVNRLTPGVFIERVTADERAFDIYQNLKLVSPSNTNASGQSASHPEKNELRLPPGLQQVQFEFTALSFIAPENVRFRYKLEGLDQNWMDAGAQRTANYTHPPPGHYQFKVVACNNDGIWNNIGDTLAITFEPYFWQTIWFRVAMTLFGLAGLYGAVVLALRRRHRLVVERLEHQRALELERNRIARDLHDDLGVGLTEIGLLGDLAGTSGEMPPASQERLREITDRARTLAASLDEIVWAINPANDTSQSFVDYFFPYAQKLLGAAGIRCRLEVAGSLPAGRLDAEQRHELFYAYKEALNNVVRHSNATQVQVTLSTEGGHLLVRIADNGCGLKNADGGSAHHGLTGMRERLQQLGGRCEITGSDGHGTTVSFVVPVQPET